MMIPIFIDPAYWPICSQDSCEQPAAFQYVWTKEMFACTEHMKKVLGIADAMGFPTPRLTAHPLVAKSKAPETDGDR